MTSPNITATTVKQSNNPAKLTLIPSERHAIFGKTVLASNRDPQETLKDE